ncbi:MAG TPA: MgtC/SapB family protein [Rhodopila sp.]|jgi:uncharacterized membrane protein YhiD involved in acid resistance
MAPDLLSWLLNSAFVRTILSLATAFVLATLIGAERQWRQRTAGLRTNVLVAVGAAAFTDLGTRLLGADGATRIISYVVPGIGLLGAGSFSRRGRRSASSADPTVLGAVVAQLEKSLSVYSATWSVSTTP